MKKLRLFLLMLCISSYVMAQQNTVSGIVSSEVDGETLPGVSVAIKGTTSGVVTDLDGKFTLNLPAGKGTLVFSYMGFVTREIDVIDGTTDLRVVLKEDQQILDEVVVVGYGSMKKRDISGASVSMGEDKLKGSVITSLDQALQGRAAGVNAVMTSGTPGSAVSIRVRGQATINANAEPLYVIDGVIQSSGSQSAGSLGFGSSLGNGSASTISPLSTINPADIVSMEILKDASALAIYGSQGSNGVVLITTKRGKSGEAKFSYDGMAGVQIQQARLDMMNLREFAEFSASISAETNGLADREEFQDPSLLGIGTNWQDAIFRHAQTQQHQISAQGGADKVKYFVSGGYMNQEGTIIGTEFKRYSFRVNLDVELKKWFKLGVNAMYSSTAEQLGLTNGEEGMLTYSLLTPPDIPIYDMEGNYAATVREGYTRVNPIALALMNDLLLDRSKLNGSLFADITPMKNLTWHAEFGYDINDSKAEVFEPTYSFGNIARAINNSSIQRNNNLFWQVTNLLTYTGQIGKHGFTAMVGQEAWESKWENMKGESTGLSSNDIHSPGLGTPESQTVSSGFGSGAMASFFTRETYNYNDRYLATYTFRYDGSSNFGPNNRWAPFHSLALSWRFNEEEFLQNELLSNGKLRLGWGQTGNQSIGSYRWGSSISLMPSGLGMGYRQSNIANPHIQWETQEQWNLGVDLGFLQNRVNLTVDLYDKTSKSMLMALQLPSYMGTSGNSSSALAAPWGNYGTINNKGLEISLNTRNMTGAFEWDTDIQLSFSKNKLVALDGTDAAHIEGYAQWGGTGLVSLSEVGKPLYNFYGYVTDGYYKDLADIENSPKPVSYPSDGRFNRDNTVWVGDIKYKDISGPDGVPDGIIDENDRTNIGSPLPKVTYGMTNTFRYKSFDLSLFVNGSIGNKILNYTSIGLTNMQGIYNNQLRDMTNRARIEVINPNVEYDGTNGVWSWYEDINNVRLANINPSAPRAISGDPNDNDRVSDRYIEDGSYLRIKNIVFGYTVPAKFVKKYHLENVRVYANIQNLYTFTNYSGFDPEIGVNTMMPNVYGLDYGRYPSPQSYTFGLSVTF